MLFNRRTDRLLRSGDLETCRQVHRLPSGPLHDAAEVARAGVPTVMMFVQSLHGISHNKIEDTREEHIEACGDGFRSARGKDDGLDRPTDVKESVQSIERAALHSCQKHIG